jgi:hypothetical protein
MGYTQCHVSMAIRKWQRLAHLKLSQLYHKKCFFFNKQTSQSRQFSRWKPTDGISCVPVSIDKLLMSLLRCPRFSVSIKMS